MARELSITGYMPAGCGRQINRGNSRGFELRGGCAVMYPLAITREHDKKSASDAMKPPNSLNTCAISFPSPDHLWTHSSIKSPPNIEQNENADL